MQFRTLAVLYLSGVASAAAIAPRADFGYWDFEGSASFPVSGYTSYRVAATYHNSELSDAIDITCTYLYNPTTKTETASCTDPSFSYDFGGVRKSSICLAPIPKVGAIVNVGWQAWRIQFRM